MINIITIRNPDTGEVVPNAGIIFPDDPMAHKYLDGLHGIEIGAAAHNPFNLEGSTSVGLLSRDTADFDFFAQEQVKMCGSYAAIEIDAEADDLPLLSGSQDYVITSHVIEHIPNLLKTFKEWDRVLRPGGYVYMIFPKRNALPADSMRPITPLNDFLIAYDDLWDANSVPQEFLAKVPGGRRGHYWVFTLDSMLLLLDYCATHLSLPWKLVDFIETDLKVGNGHTVVLQKES